MFRISCLSFGADFINILYRGHVLFSKTAVLTNDTRSTSAILTGADLDSA